jgi:RecB family endonuclease NucS
MVEQVNVDMPFVLLADCSVKYDGRAASDLENGTYLILHKGDGTLLIHGAALFNPLNYQPPGAVMRRSGNTLISERKKETIVIAVSNLHWYKELRGLSAHKIKISKTERELRDSIIRRLPELIGVQVSYSGIEHDTPRGKIDIFAIENGKPLYHVIEVKRNKAALSACAQLERYLGYYHDIEKPVKGWLMSPEISSGARSYCEARGLNWVKVVHQTPGPVNPQPPVRPSS